MSLIPLSLGQPAEIHDDHEQLRELHSTAYGAVKEITQKHIQKGQKHHEHKQTHGGGISRGTKRACLFQNSRRAEQSGGKGGAAFFCGMGGHKRILAVRNRRKTPCKQRTQAARAVPRMGAGRRGTPAQALLHLEHFNGEMRYSAKRNNGHSDMGTLNSGSSSRNFRYISSAGSPFSLRNAVHFSAFTFSYSASALA